MLEFVVALVVVEERIAQELLGWKQDREGLSDLPSLPFSSPQELLTLSDIGINNK